MLHAGRQDRVRASIKRAATTPAIRSTATATTTTASTRLPTGRHHARLGGPSAQGSNSDAVLRAIVTTRALGPGQINNDFTRHHPD